MFLDKCGSGRDGKRRVKICYLIYRLHHTTDRFKLEQNLQQMYILICINFYCNIKIKDQNHQLLDFKQTLQCMCIGWRAVYTQDIVDADKFRTFELHWSAFWQCFFSFVNLQLITKNLFYLRFIKTCKRWQMLNRSLYGRVFKYLQLY